MIPQKSYDFSLCLTSLYILIPALFTETYALSFLLGFLATVSVMHWKHYDSWFWQCADRCVGAVTFLTHLCLLTMKEDRDATHHTVAWAGCAMTVFCLERACARPSSKATLHRTSPCCSRHMPFSVSASSGS